MALRIKAPQHSFVQFGESDAIQSCQFSDIVLCLPVYQDNDVTFQFIIEADSESEADALCDLTNAKITIGIVDNCADDFILEFNEKTERFRISTTQVLYNWSHGLTGFGSVISVGECFYIKIQVQGIYTLFEFCSNCFYRINNPCHTSVVDYNNDDNAYGFDYCGGTAVDDDSSDACEPTIIEFTNLATIAIPYTAQLQAKYGTVPTVQVWIYDGTDLVDIGLRISFDTFPVTVISIDFGGVSSGIIKIS